MDKRNDVTGALAAYREAVSRLKSVMARVGVEPTENGRPRKSTGRAEEEGRTLRGIVSVAGGVWHGNPPLERPADGSTMRMRRELSC
jgi:hypothetical protein